MKVTNLENHQPNKDFALDAQCIGSNPAEIIEYNRLWEEKNFNKNIPGYLSDPELSLEAKTVLNFMYELNELGPFKNGVLKDYIVQHSKATLHQVEEALAELILADYIGVIG